MTPALKAVPPIPYVSSNPAISFPILLIWLIVTWQLAKYLLKSAADKPAAGLKLGLVFSITSIALDLVVLVYVLDAGFRFYLSASVWVAYCLLFFIPWKSGRAAG